MSAPLRDLVHYRIDHRVKETFVRQGRLISAVGVVLQQNVQRIRI